MRAGALSCLGDEHRCLFDEFVVSVAGSRIDVTMHDFGIEVSRRSVPAGKVVLHVTNNGPSTHEINVDLHPLRRRDDSAAT